ncbi:hypothetical protein PRIPAC_76031 [Pristionchus pacificus]|uniref:Helicase n=1 Tax=Pristionchus pacificus TaxID=54126 RepID=A0A2A6CFP6_PRIPA|nr:hypothetical protein PRIPAC_76740 [Pristionchus pacificus]KAF8386889.1 hypothetical protein PRIPAC_76031 [Pristionchus pacificus]|eukprot:PDM75603.1 helicase [Pristionchus pacificus]
MKSIQNGKDLMACSQTGSGKTATFLLPIMNSLLWYTDPSLITDVPCKPQARILAPTKVIPIGRHYCRPLKQTQYLVLDEADRMLDMGFAEEVMGYLCTFNLMLDLMLI